MCAYSLLTINAHPVTAKLRRGDLAAPSEQVVNFNILSQRNDYVPIDALNHAGIDLSIPIAVLGLPQSIDSRHHCRSSCRSDEGGFLISILHFREAAEHGFSSIGGRLELSSAQNLLLHLGVRQQFHDAISVIGVDEPLILLRVGPVL